MDIVSTYNPANANITKDQLSAMRDLTDADIETLAKAYPNQPQGNAYLVYYMKNEKDTEQRYPLGTWANLNALRKIGRKDVLPFGFKKSHVRPAINQPPAPQRVIDLSAKDIESAEGLKVSETNVDHVVALTDAKYVAPVKINTDIVTNADQERRVVNVTPVASPELTAAKAELQKAIDEKQHHMTVKMLQANVDKLSTEKTN